ncbi:MAG: hypothetical protein JEZ03_03975, partial [Bacteroidales bacterium]|nr:hypothetical protein [Bacteroidales bacterium]
MNKLILIVISCLLFGMMANGQVITVEPEFPTVSDQLIITFNALEGNAELANHQGDLWAHT